MATKGKLTERKPEQAKPAVASWLLLATACLREGWCQPAHGRHGHRRLTVAALFRHTRTTAVSFPVLSHEEALKKHGRGEKRRGATR
ncbi:hypothetical protein E2562_001756 [Oryza meyeriana var. granulata]|uniref:Uncharacterized protein n=1 Tax=Oryza meyeriana var. granulata TaxID=110450 RepID=A0A6G1CEA7_9ORYZ|nr:hypothetical protein E2562_001756 [Oryza meyeriana var. granulata]